MAFIRCHGLKYNEDGTIKSGSASLLESVYIKDAKYHSKQVVRERLGKVIFLSEDQKSGIFLSPTRGLVAYDARTDTFTPVQDEKHKDNQAYQEVHSSFGDVYLWLCLMKKEGFLQLLRDMFEQDDYKRVLCHLLYETLRNGRKISCYEFINNSFASYVFDDFPIDSLNHDEAYLALMGEESIKRRFFKNFVKMMREKEPGFGQGVYVDTKALLYDLVDDPYGALTCDGNPSVRLVLVLDEKTGLPLWYEVIDDDPLDHYTIDDVRDELHESIDVKIHSFLLDAPYASLDLFDSLTSKEGQDFIIRMPQKKAYPYKALYFREKNEMTSHNYVFSYNRHIYFGKQEVIQLFDHDLYAYVYVDRNKAINGFRRFHDEFGEYYEEMPKPQQEFYQDKFGYFVLLSNKETSPQDLLKTYLTRAQSEALLKEHHEKGDLLETWNDTYARGLIFSQLLVMIITSLMKYALRSTHWSLSYIFNSTQTLMSSVNRYGNALIEAPSEAAKACFEALNIDVPAHLKKKALKKALLLK